VGKQAPRRVSTVKRLHNQRKQKRPHTNEKKKPGGVPGHVGPSKKTKGAIPMLLLGISNGCVNKEKQKEKKRAMDA